MATAVSTSKRMVELHVWLNAEEAQRLANMVQNPLYHPEDPDDQHLREVIFKALTKGEG